MNIGGTNQFLQISDTWIEGRNVLLRLNNGQLISFPAEDFPRLATANAAELSQITLRLKGTALRWEAIDEDISLPGIVTRYGK